MLMKFLEDFCNISRQKLLLCKPTYEQTGYVMTTLGDSMVAWRQYGRQKATWNGSREKNISGQGPDIYIISISACFILAQLQSDLDRSNNHQRLDHIAHAPTACFLFYFHVKKIYLVYCRITLQHTRLANQGDQNICFKSAFLI